MNSKNHWTRKVIAMVVTVSLLNVFALTGLGVTPEPASVKGRLVTSRNQSVVINGNVARDGQTVLTGSVIETPGNFGATVNLVPLGSVKLAPGTKVELAFSDVQIKLRLTHGCAILRNNEGAYGEISNAKGIIASSDPTRKQASVLDACYTGAPNLVTNDSAPAGAGGRAVLGGGFSILGLGPFWSAAVLAAGGLLTTLAITVPCRRGRNPSPGQPRGRNEECR